MKLVQFFIVCVLFNALLISCGRNSEAVETEQEIKTDTLTLYGDSSFVFPVISENAKKFTNTWGAFDDFQVEAKAINGSTSEALLIKTDRLVQRLDSLANNVPDTLQTQPINSRVMVATTRAKMLHQIVRKSRLDSVELQNSIEELNYATRNLMIQLNEKFQKDAIDLQKKDYEKKELEKQKRFLDSVYQAELQDKEND